MPVAEYRSQDLQGYSDPETLLAAKQSEGQQPTMVCPPVLRLSWELQKLCKLLHPPDRLEAAEPAVDEQQSQQGGVRSFPGVPEFCSPVRPPLRSLDTFVLDQPGRSPRRLINT